MDKKMKMFLLKELKDYMIEDYDVPTLKDKDDLHDLLLQIYVGDSQIEEYDFIYYLVVTTINKHGDEMIDEIKNFIDENSTGYFGDPAFSSASDYWSYKMG